MDYTAIEVKRQNGVTWLVFNRPEKKNAMNPTLHREMHAALSELEQDAETRVLVITGKGDSFCAGEDLKEYFYELKDKPGESERIGLITKAVPRAQLDKETREIANNLLEKDSFALKAVKEAWYYTFYSPPDVAYEISGLISDRVKREHGGRPGIRQFAEKRYRPGLGAYKWEK